MHILFLTDNFPPEGNAPATRTYEHAREWVKQGHRVTVITCAPNFPEGKVFEGYKNKWFSKETIEGIEVRRVKTYITANEGFVKRILDYLSFMVTGFLASLFVKKVDVVVATSPQFFTACSGWAVSAIMRIPFVFELRDIWPASITAVGAMKKSLVIKVLESVEMFLYRRADKIISVTHRFKEELIDRGIEDNKIEVVLNGVDLSKYCPMEKDDEFLLKYDLKDKFVAGYIGTHGLAHSLETIVEAAERLIDRKEIVFLFAGGGTGSQLVKDLVSEKKLKNVRVLGRIEKQYMPRIWSLCDVSIVHLKNVPLFESVIPSKIFESMGMGLPIAIGLPKGEATNIILDNGCGVVFEPENSEMLANTVQTLSDDSDWLKVLAKQSLKSSRKFERKALANQMLEIINLN
ncbi:MAG: glycosyltransferase family 4 protein [Kangiellaceae bacterium]|nr:glycosyltransferase family 4 protein [Kangiellaceae bacterium]MCW8997989.1 glycosyltransferase family 4 protein [Kangiellaceae bacterium]MCW9015768.1 glycosyltransferase family 4 protein [Kangiellaceae bacterium]